MNIMIIGCGAITQNVHLPAISNIKEINNIFLVDKNVDYMKEISKLYKISNFSTDYNDFISQSDFALLCVPNNLHCKISMDLLEKGLNVLCEKPMAITTEDCDKMINKSKEKNKILKIGHYLRYSLSIKFIKKLIDERHLGAIKSFSGTYGWEWNWTSKTNFYLDKNLVGGGVLLDSGSHIIDLVLFLLGDCVKFNYYETTGIYGPDILEDEVNIELKMKEGYWGKICNSRIRTLENNLKIIGEKGFVEINLGSPTKAKLFIRDYKECQSGSAIVLSSYINPYESQILDMISDIKNNNRQDFGETFKQSISLIEKMYNYGK